MENDQDNQFNQIFFAQHRNTGGDCGINKNEKKKKIKTRMSKKTVLEEEEGHHADTLMHVCVCVCQQKHLIILVSLEK